jgi:glucose-1-phosphate thymidylyltransferase
MLAGIREILIITTPQDSTDFQNLLGDGNSLGISINYAIQPKPEGLAQAFIIGENFIDGDSISLILGDNIFYGSGLGRRLSQITSLNGATIFGLNVEEPQRYGVLEISKSGRILSIEEKPLNPKSNIAVPGLYFFDNTVTSRAKLVKKSDRGELEITSIIDSYLVEKKLEYRILRENTVWMDCGTVASINEAANYVKKIEQDTNFKIGCIEEVAFRQGWIGYSEMSDLVRSLGKNEYTKYLMKILENSSTNER